MYLRCSHRYRLGYFSDEWEHTPLVTFRSWTRVNQCCRPHLFSYRSSIPGSTGGHVAGASATYENQALRVYANYPSFGGFCCRLKCCLSDAWLLGTLFILTIMIFKTSPKTLHSKNFFRIFLWEMLLLNRVTQQTLSAAVWKYWEFARQNRNFEILHILSKKKSLLKHFRKSQSRFQNNFLFRENRQSCVHIHCKGL